jgi:hypothetical protein
VHAPIGLDIGFMASMLGVVLADNVIDAVRLLGAHQRHVVPADRLRARAPGGAGGAAGLAGDRAAGAWRCLPAC